MLQCCSVALSTQSCWLGLTDSELTFSTSIQHGRAKVQTTEEQDEAKRREEEKKVNAYRRAADAIYTKVGAVISDAAHAVQAIP